MEGTRRTWRLGGLAAPGPEAAGGSRSGWRHRSCQRQGSRARPGLAGAGCWVHDWGCWARSGGPRPPPGCSRSCPHRYRNAQPGPSPPSSASALRPLSAPQQGGSPEGTPKRFGRGCALQQDHWPDRSAPARQSRRGKDAVSGGAVRPQPPQPPPPTDLTPRLSAHHKAPGAGSSVSSSGTSRQQC